MNTTKTIIDRIRGDATVAIAIAFNCVTFTYTLAGVKALEGGHSATAALFCTALTLIKLLFEKDFCANLFRPRPMKAILTTLGFVFFFVTAVFFNLLNIAVVQVRANAEAADANAAARRWHDDSESVSKALAGLKASVAQALAENHAAQGGARSTGADLEPLRQERRILARAQADANAIVPLPVEPPANRESGAELLSAAVAGVRNAAALLPSRWAGKVPEISLSTVKAPSSGALADLEALAAKGAEFVRAASVAVFMELFSVFALIGGYAGLTWAERIHGIKATAHETRRAVLHSPGQSKIPFSVRGRHTRGTLVLAGAGPVSYSELVRAVDEASAVLPYQAVAMYTARQELLDPDAEVLRQLEGNKLILEVEDK